MTIVLACAIPHSVVDPDEYTGAGERINATGALAGCRLVGDQPNIDTALLSRGPGPRRCRRRWYRFAWRSSFDDSAAVRIGWTAVLRSLAV